MKPATDNGLKERFDNLLTVIGNLQKEVDKLKAMLYEHLQQESGNEELYY